MPSLHLRPRRPETKYHQSHFRKQFSLLLQSCFCLVTMSSANPNLEFLRHQQLLELCLHSNLFLLDPSLSLQFLFWLFLSLALSKLASISPRISRQSHQNRFFTQAKCTFLRQLTSAEDCMVTIILPVDCFSIGQGSKFSVPSCCLYPYNYVIAVAKFRPYSS